MKTITEILELIVIGFFLIVVCMMVAGCGTIYKLVEQPDGTYKKIPIMACETFAVDLSCSEKETAVLSDVKFILTDGTKVEAENAIITTEKSYSTRGRTEGVSKNVANAVQGSLGVVM